MTLLLLLSKQELHRECDCTLVGIGSDFAWTNKNIRKDFLQPYLQNKN